MAKFRYLGDVPDGVSITQYGVEFTPGGVVEVRDPWAINKLKGNRFFECVEDDPEPYRVPKPDYVPVEEPQQPDERDALRAKAASLGIHVDGRWSAKKLKRVIAEAESEDNGEA